MEKTLYICEPTTTAVLFNCTLKKLTLKVCTKVAGKECLLLKESNREPGRVPREPGRGGCTAPASERVSGSNHWSYALAPTAPAVLPTASI